MPFTTQKGTIVDTIAKEKDGQPFMLHDGSILNILKRDTGSNMTEAHLTCPNRDSFVLNTATCQHETDGHQWQFDICQASGDIFCFMLNDTGSGHTEVHIMTRASNYQEFCLQTGTGLEETDHETWRFRVGPNRDIYAIKTKHTGAGQTEVHIMTADSKYQDFSLRDGTVLNETDGETDNVDFLVNQHNGDIVYIAKDHTGSNTTEVHVMSKDSGFKSFTTQTGTALHETDEHWNFAIPPEENQIAGFLLKHTDTGKLEHHQFTYP